MRDKLFMIAFVAVLGSALTALLVVVNDYTAPFIERNREKKLKAGVLSALGVPSTDESVEKIFGLTVTMSSAGGKIFYVSARGTAFEISGMGLWGPIKGVVAIDKGRRTVEGITIIHQEETPGLGGKIAEPDFLDGFRGKKFEPRLRLVAPGSVRSDNEVDAITGATMTSKAFEDILNANLADNLELLEGRRR